MCATKSILSFAARLLVCFLIGLTPVLAGKADPQTGYNSLYDIIMDVEKGPNNGRCNAIGALGTLICNTTGNLMPDIRPVTERCATLGITIDVPEYCIPVDCEVSAWSEWSVCDANTLTQTRNRTVVTDAENGGRTCPELTETRDCTVDQLPATISNLRFLGITENSATMAWETDDDAFAQLEVTSPQTGTVYHSAQSTSLSTQALVTIDGLSASTLYEARAIATTSSGAVTVSDPLSFQTRRSGGTQF